MITNATGSGSEEAVWLNIASGNVDYAGPMLVVGGK